MKQLIVLSLILGVGCDRRDDCEKVMDRLGENTKANVTRCRDEMSIRENPMFRCVLAAESDQAVKKCGIVAAADLMAEREAAVGAKQKAEDVARTAVKEAQEARESVAVLERQVSELIVQINTVIAQIDAAKTEADRVTAKQTLATLQRQQAELQQRIAEAKTKAAKSERAKGAKISRECLENPLTPGCS